MCDGKQLFLNGCERRQRYVVLIAALCVLPPFCHHSDNTKSQLSDTEHLPNRIVARKEIVHDGLADDNYAGCCFNIGFSKKRAALNLPFADQREILIDSLDHAVPVLIAEDHLLS